MSKKYLTASEIATFVRCNRMFYYSRLYPDYNQDAPILLEGIARHERHAWLILLQRKIKWIIVVLILVGILVVVARVLN